MKKFRCCDDSCLNLLSVQIAADLAKPFRIIKNYIKVQLAVYSYNVIPHF